MNHQINISSNIDLMKQANISSKINTNKSLIDINALPYEKALDQDKRTFCGIF